MSGTKNEKSRFTRMCIGEAIIELLKETDLKHLKILSIVKKAGFSHMTFYKYYTSPRAALEDYLHIIITGYLDEIRAEEPGAFLTYEHILAALLFFDRYRSFFLVMKEQGLYSILIDSVNQFLSEHMQTEVPVSIYKRYSYAGGLLNCFLMWEEHEKQESAEAVAETIYELYGIHDNEKE